MAGEAVATGPPRDPIDRRSFDASPPLSCTLVPSARRRGPKVSTRDPPRYPPRARGISPRRKISIPPRASPPLQSPWPSPEAAPCESTTTSFSHPSRETMTLPHRCVPRPNPPTSPRSTLTPPRRRPERILSGRAQSLAPRPRVSHGRTQPHLGRPSHRNPPTATWRSVQRVLRRRSRVRVARRR